MGNRTYDIGQRWLYTILIRIYFHFDRTTVTSTVMVTARAGTFSGTGAVTTNATVCC